MSYLTQIVAEWEQVNNLDIRVVGNVDEETDLPAPQTYTGAYGDAYAVGTEPPYSIYVFTRPFEGEEYPHWFDIGTTAIIGPQGPQGATGATGPQGTRGSIWTTAAGNPSAVGFNQNDQYLNTSDGSVFQYSGGVWTRTGNIKGPAGPQGAQGATGAQGAIGPQGPQGPQGEAGSSFYVAAIVANTSLLPTAGTVPTSAAYLVGAAQPYDMYIQVEGVWTNVGQVQGVEGPTGPQGPQGPQGATGAPGSRGYAIWSSSETPGTVQSHSFNANALSGAIQASFYPNWGDIIITADGRIYQIQTTYNAAQSYYSANYVSSFPTGSPASLYRHDISLALDNGYSDSLRIVTYSLSATPLTSSTFSSVLPEGNTTICSGYISDNGYYGAAMTITCDRDWDQGIVGYSVTAIVGDGSGSLTTHATGIYELSSFSDTVTAA